MWVLSLLGERSGVKVHGKGNYVVVKVESESMQKLEAR